MKILKDKILDFVYTLTRANKRILKLQQEIESLKKYINDLMKYQIHCQDDNPEFYPIVLTCGEQELLKRYLYTAKNYLEFGSGGSTFLSVNFPNLNIYSVESDQNWIKYLSSWKIIKNAIDEKRLYFIHIDIGTTGEWGFPVDLSQKNKFYRYSSDVFEQNAVKFDTVFVDGRFRVACVLKTIMQCSDDVVILIHDYPDRDYYHVIENYLDIVDKIDNLYVFKKKLNIDYNEIESCYEEYKEIFY